MNPQHVSWYVIQLGMWRCSTCRREKRSIRAKEPAWSEPVLWPFRIEVHWRDQPVKDLARWFPRPPMPVLFCFPFQRSWSDCARHWGLWPVTALGGARGPISTARSHYCSFLDEEVNPKRCLSCDALELDEKPHDKIVNCFLGVFRPTVVILLRCIFLCGFLSLATTPVLGLW